ncbi:MAG: hypothetical protein L6V85_08185 [Clostridiales bacterium]|nr:MAG: hypothetical protein L6V85_08185 [Clostridiales bacterium]
MIAGKNRTEFIKVEFYGDNGSEAVLVPNENGDIDFSELEEGKYTLFVIDDNGEAIMYYDVTIANTSEPDQPDNPNQPENPDKPNTPTEPENPDEPTNPDEPNEPTAPEQPDDSKDTDNTDNTDNNGQSKKKIPASVILLPILLVLGIGGLVTYIVIKKKKTGKNKKSEQKENE